MNLSSINDKVRQVYAISCKNWILVALDLLLPTLLFMVNIVEQRRNKEHMLPKIIVRFLYILRCRCRVDNSWFLSNLDDRDRIKLTYSYYLLCVACVTCAIMHFLFHKSKVHVEPSNISKCHLGSCTISICKISSLNFHLCDIWIRPGIDQMYTLI